MSNLSSPGGGSSRLRVGIKRRPVASAKPPCRQLEPALVFHRARESTTCHLLAADDGPAGPFRNGWGLSTATGGIAPSSRLTASSLLTAAAATAARTHVCLVRRGSRTPAAGPEAPIDTPSSGHCQLAAATGSVAYLITLVQRHDEATMRYNRQLYVTLRVAMTQDPIDYDPAVPLYSECYSERPDTCTTQDRT